MHGARLLHYFFDLLRKHPAMLWVFIPIVALNIWFDYYHPGGIVLDVIIVLALLIKCDSGPDKA
jgi:hypothetical protein